MITINEIKTEKDYLSFVNLPFSIYKNNKYWVPPLIDSELKILKPETNPAFDECEAKFWLAYKDNKLVGRIGAIINHEYNKKVNEKIGRFTRLEYYDDFEVCKMLLKTAEDWLISKGMTRVLGPLGFNNLDKQGLLIEGFEYIAAFGSSYHYLYYHKHIESLGYTKEIDWLEFRFKYDDIPEKGIRISEIIQKKYKLRVLDLKTKKELKQYIVKIFKLINDTYVDLPFVSLFSDKMIEFYSNKYLNFIQPRFMKIIVNTEDEIVGFILAMPSVAEAMQKAKGKLFPFGFYYILKALKKPKEFELLLAGINPRFQGLGVAAMIMTSLQGEFLKYLKPGWVETTGNFETNHKAHENWKNYESTQHKRKRCYQKALN